MDITKGNLNILTTSFSAAFSAGLGTVPPMYQRIAMTVPSSTSENVYAWLKDISGLREWLGDRVIDSLAIDGYRIRNKKFEKAIAVKRDDIEDDQYGVYAPMFQMLGENAARHPNELAFDLLNNGFSQKCYDGQNFFDTDHPVLDKDGKEKGVSNFMGGTEPTWYLACTSRAVKPLIFQTRKPVKFTAMDAPTDEHVFMRDEYRYGVDTRCNVGFGLWQMMVASKQPLTAENYEKARAALTGMVKDHGGKLALTADLLLVPTDLEGAGRRLINAELLGNNGVTETNTWKGTTEVLACPWLEN